MTSRDNNRIVRPFEWGLDWTRNWPGVGDVPAPEEQGDREAMVRYMSAVNDHLAENSDEFFRYERPCSFELSGDILTFESPVATPHAKNNLAHARWFPAAGYQRASRPAASSIIAPSSAACWLVPVPTRMTRVAPASTPAGSARSSPAIRSRASPCERIMRSSAVDVMPVLSP